MSDVVSLSKEIISLVGDSTTYSDNGVVVGTPYPLLISNYIEVVYASGEKEPNRLDLAMRCLEFNSHILKLNSLSEDNRGLLISLILSGRELGPELTPTPKELK